MILRTALSAVVSTAAGIAVGATSAAAQDFDPYFEIGAGQVFEENFDTTGITARAGLRTRVPSTTFLDAVAAEGEFFYGIDGEDTGNVEAKVAYSFSATGRAIWEVASNVDLFARAGLDVSKAEVEGSGFFAGGEAEDTEVGLLIGAGTELRLSPRTGVRFDFSHRNDYNIVQLAYAVRF
ncbi:MAG: outer membrane beta-barrel protein [Pseudomonadota bacterium]